MRNMYVMAPFLWFDTSAPNILDNTAKRAACVTTLWKKRRILLAINV